IQKGRGGLERIGLLEIAAFPPEQVLDRTWQQGTRPPAWSPADRGDGNGGEVFQGLYRVPGIQNVEFGGWVIGWQPGAQWSECRRQVMGRLDGEVGLGHLYQLFEAVSLVRWKGLDRFEQRAGLAQHIHGVGGDGVGFHGMGYGIEKLHLRPAGTLD